MTFKICVCVCACACLCVHVSVCVFHYLCVQPQYVLSLFCHVIIFSLVLLIDFLSSA